MQDLPLLIAVAALGALGGAVFASVLGHLVYAYVGVG